MIDPAFLKYVEEGSKYIVKIAEQLPRQIENYKKDISPEAAKKIQEAITFSDLKSKLVEFQDARKDLDNAINKYK